MPVEDRFDTTFIAALSSREKQIQQTYRPVIGIHKWFARRPGTLFRGLLLAEFGEEELADAFWKSHRIADKLIADPFMGGGTPLVEANRMGMRVIGSDINPMAYWVVRQTLAKLDLTACRAEAERVAQRVESAVGHLYETQCTKCRSIATVKYFHWVKSYPCGYCGHDNDLFPGYMLATNDRHTSFVWYCPACQNLAEVPHPPKKGRAVACPHCTAPLQTDAYTKRGRFFCNRCTGLNSYPVAQSTPQHRLFAMEYHCSHCAGAYKGRHFKVPDTHDLARLAVARQRLMTTDLPLIPADEIPAGDETNRLHRWGYRYYRDLFNERQLLGLHTLLSEITRLESSEIKLALITIFSDMLRYQNMLCRYDTMALKCQDIFSVHGFPVGLIQCENNLLGIPHIGSGGFRHFVEKYLRAKEYCVAPYEVRVSGKSRKQVPTPGEQVGAEFASHLLGATVHGAYLHAGDSSTLAFEPESLDGVFTDPPYFDNVQYAELIDFCFIWLRRVLSVEHPAFRRESTRHARELTGNMTMGRGLSQFTAGLSAVFQRIAVGLKQHAALVFTYHHNEDSAYLPIIVAILDAGLLCTDTLAAPAEMAASLHISGTSSSTIDSIFVCRKGGRAIPKPDRSFPHCLVHDVAAIRKAGVRVRPGDILCMALGHLSRLAIGDMAPAWNRTLPVERKLEQAQNVLGTLLRTFSPKDLAHQMSEEIAGSGVSTL